MKAMKSILCVTVLACAAAAMPQAALASAVTVSSYTMLNGGTGSFQYWDHNYLPCTAGDCTTTGAPLSGGTGELTDGVLPALDWNVAMNPEPWVGWDNGQTGGLNPVVTFNFAGTVTINSVTVWFDNTLGFGGVGAPGLILVNGAPYTPPQNVSGAQAFTISGLNITGNSINVQFDQAGGTDTWVMIGEVSFNGSPTPPIPEPSTGLLLGTGLACLIGMSLGLKRLS